MTDQPDVAGFLSEIQDKTTYFKHRADFNKYVHYALRTFAIVSGICLPLMIQGGVQHFATTGLSVALAISISMEEYFRYGEMWRHNRQAQRDLEIIVLRFTKGVLTWDGLVDEVVAVLREEVNAFWVKRPFVVAAEPREVDRRAKSLK